MEKRRGFIKRLFRFLFSRTFIVSLSLIMQLSGFVIIIWRFSTSFFYFHLFFVVLSLTVVFYILNDNRINPAYELAWIIPILLAPIFGGFFYLTIGKTSTNRRFHNKLMFIDRRTRQELHQDKLVMDSLEQKSHDAARQAAYLQKYAHFPTCRNTTAQYLSPGESFFDCLKRELEQAKHYIFLEFFIIEGGRMWGDILEILRRKASEGVDVRLIYDDVGCLHTLPYKYDQTMRRMGIKCSIFNPFRPVLSSSLNNRDHRKIVVIDGHTAFTGGVNLADEYINQYEKHGHWKDAGILLKGDAVWNFTIMFLTMWNFLNTTEDNYQKYLPHVHHSGSFDEDGYITPYCDSPIDGEPVGEQVYLNAISRARKSICIETPYLIMDNATLTALRLAAKSGVDVRIITPGIPDKWYVHTMTRAHYSQLLECGVRIYEYTPGFIHSKVVLVDDVFGVVGTINLDYRSLYLHFECAVWMYKTQAVLDAKRDFVETMALCREITMEDCRAVKWPVRFIRMAMRVFAPLM